MFKSGPNDPEQQTGTKSYKKNDTKSRCHPKKLTVTFLALAMWGPTLCMSKVEEAANAESGMCPCSIPRGFASQPVTFLLFTFFAVKIIIFNYNFLWVSLPSHCQIVIIILAMVGWVPAWVFKVKDWKIIPPSDLNRAHQVCFEMTGSCCCWHWAHPHHQYKY